MAIFLVLLIFVYSVIVMTAADNAVISLRRIARSAHVGVFALSAIIMALGTSFPELFVSITSALEGISNLSLGVIIGSNIANISLIAGFAAFKTGRIKVEGNFLKRDIYIGLLAGLLPILLSIDGSLSRIDGAIFLILYLSYALGFLKNRFRQVLEEHHQESFIHRFFRKIFHINGDHTKEISKFLFWLAALTLASDIVVKLSQNLAFRLNIPIYLVGLVLLAIGTSLPELALSFESLKDHEPSIFFGNLLGSTIANSTLIIGVSILIKPVIKIPINEYMISACAFVITYLTFWYFIKTKRTLERWEAGILLLLYMVFISFEFLMK